MIPTIATINEIFRRSLIPVLLVCGLFTLLGGCVTTGTGTAVECGAFRRITYSASKDTPTTKKQIRILNKTMDNLQCPK